jgi:hypothetical protein
MSVGVLALPNRSFRHHTVQGGPRFHNRPFGNRVHTRDIPHPLDALQPVAPVTKHMPSHTQGPHQS